MNNPQALDSRDVAVPNVEIAVAAAAARSPHGDAETHPEPVDENRTADLVASAPALPWWISEKYFWNQGTNGGFYLRPFPEYVAYVADKAPKAVNAGIEVCYPQGEHGKTQECDIIAQAIDEVQALASSLKALNDLEGSAFEKFLVERCLRNAVYAATTQFELVNWSARETARGNDVGDNTNYGEKMSRKAAFMTTAGALYALIRETLPNADVSPAAFAKMANRVIYDTARMEGAKLRTPAQLTESQQAGVEAARLTVEDF